VAEGFARTIVRKQLLKGTKKLRRRVVFSFE
jgi:hypothetical protein